MRVDLQDLSQRVVIVSGKGGVGKTTVTGLLARLLEDGGSSVLAVEVDPRESLHRLFGVQPSGGEAVTVSPHLRLLHLTYQQALEAVVRAQIGSGWLRRRILGSSAWAHVAAGAPGFKELAVLWWLYRQLDSSQDERWTPHTIVLDAPAGGHTAAWLQAPFLVADAVHSGPVAEEAQRLARRLRDGEQTAVVLVSTAEEMPVTETLEMQAALRQMLGQGGARLCFMNCVYAAPDSADRDDARRDSALAHWVRRADDQAEEMRRLASTIGTPVQLLPMLPVTSGPALLDGLTTHLGDVLRPSNDGEGDS